MNNSQFKDITYGTWLKNLKMIQEPQNTVVAYVYERGVSITKRAFTAVKKAATCLMNT